MPKYNYHITYPNSCSTCINIVRPEYPYLFQCKLTNKIVDVFGICDKYERDSSWNKKE